MPYKKVPCPVCGKPKSRHAKTCRSCSVPYERTDEWRQNMSQRLKGKSPRGVGWQHSEATRQKMKDVWTSERREMKRKEMLARNPYSIYHGLSCKAAQKIRQAIGHCENCGSTQNLDIHHLNGDKHDHSLHNLTVLCHQCHMREHANQKETGWDSYWKKRKMNPN